MKIVFQNRMGETITRESFVGQKLVGLRINQIIFETSAELYALTTDKGQRWIKEHAHKIMPYSTKIPITEANSPP